VLGFGFGAVKGLISATLLFLLLVLLFEVAYGGSTKRPEWMTKSRTYPLLNASGDALSSFIRERQAESEDGKSDAG
jgi:membrane protein required for colicin V production